MRVSNVIREYYSLSNSQKESFECIIHDMFSLNIQLADIRPVERPRCHCTDGFTKAGFEPDKHIGGKRKSNPYARKQMYRCKACGKRFVYDSGTMTHNFKITQDEFVEICKDTILRVPIKKIAARLNRSVQYVFENRHKFLCFLEKALEQEKSRLAGTVELNETYPLDMVYYIFAKLNQI